MKRNITLSKKWRSPCGGQASTVNLQSENESEREGKHRSEKNVKTNAQVSAHTEKGDTLKFEAKILYSEFSIERKISCTVFQDFIKGNDAK